MPTTIAAIAEQCGVSKPTVTNNLRRLGLWDDHVTKSPGNGAFEVDDFAASAVCNDIMKRKASRSPSDNPEDILEALPVLQDGQQVDFAKVERLYEGMIDQLKGQIAAMERQIAAMERQAVDLRGQIDILQSVTTDYQQQNKDLRDAISEHQKALPAAREEGRQSEHDRIRALGLFDRLFGNF